MANIQSSINQMMSLSGLLMSQNPAIQEAVSKRAGIRAIRKEAKNLQSRAKATIFSEVPSSETIEAIRLSEELENEGLEDAATTVIQSIPEEERKAEQQRLSDLNVVAERAVGLSGQLFEIDPTKETYEKFKAGRESLSKFQKTLSRFERAEQKFREADESAAAKQEERREIRRRILEGTPSQFNGGM